MVNDHQLSELMRRITKRRNVDIKVGDGSQDGAEMARIRKTAEPAESPGPGGRDRMHLSECGRVLKGLCRKIQPLKRKTSG